MAFPAPLDGFFLNPTPEARLQTVEGLREEARRFASVEPRRTGSTTIMGPKFCGCRDADALVQRGATLSVHVGFDPDFDDTITGSLPDLPPDEITALLDTAAGVSCIDNTLVQKLKLPFLREGTIATIHGRREANIYEAQVRITSLDCTICGPFRGADIVFGGPQVLLGRDFLKHYTMVYNGLTGSVTLAAG
jgi:hypothetical protein